jgi:hypothetical protein
MYCCHRVSTNCVILLPGVSQMCDVLLPPGVNPTAVAYQNIPNLLLRMCKPFLTPCCRHELPVVRLMHQSVFVGAAYGATHGRRVGPACDADSSLVRSSGSHDQLLVFVLSASVLSAAVLSVSVLSVAVLCTAVADPVAGSPNDITFIFYPLYPISETAFFKVTRLRPLGQSVVLR